MTNQAEENIIKKRKIFEDYFREEMKTWCYNEVKRKFFYKYECYGFLMANYHEKETSFYYTYDLDEYKQCCPKCIVFE